MRNTLALIGALVVGFAGVGWYLGWYKLNVAKTTDGNLRVETNVDTSKVVKDTEAGAKHVGELIGDHLEKARQDAKTGPQPTPGTTPGPVAPPQPETKPRTGGSWLFGPGFTTATGK